MRIFVPFRGQSGSIRGRLVDRRRAAGGEGVSRAIEVGGIGAANPFAGPDYSRAKGGSMEPSPRLLGYFLRIFAFFVWPAPRGHPLACTHRRIAPPGDPPAGHHLRAAALRAAMIARRAPIITALRCTPGAPRAGHHLRHGLRSSSSEVGAAALRVANPSQSPVPHSKNRRLHFQMN